MPYIKVSLRKKYNPDIELLKQNKQIEELVAKIKDEPLTAQDGIVNYIITKMLKDETSNSEYAILQEFLTEFYIINESYFYYNRLRGLLGCMEDEFQRRKWSFDGLQIISCLRRFFVKYRIAEYEDRKIIENGDL